MSNIARIALLDKTWQTCTRVYHDMIVFGRGTLRPRLLSPWLALLMLLVALQITFLLWIKERAHAEEAQEVEFRHLTQTAEMLIVNQIDEYQQILTGVEQLYRSSNHVSADEFHAYVSDFINQWQDQGLQAIGFIKYIDLQDKQTQVDLDLPLPTLLSALKPAHHEKIFAPVVYIEPRLALNKALLWQNVFANAQTRTELLRMVGQEKMVLANSPLLEAEGHAVSAHLLYLPVYSHPPHANQAKKLPRILNGWIFMRMSTEALLRNVLAPLEQQYVHFDISDVTDSKPYLLYHTEKNGAVSHQHLARIVLNNTLKIHGRIWRIQARSTTQFESAIQYQAANQIALSGIFISLLLSGIVYFAVLRLRAHEMLKRFNRELDESEQRWRFAVEGTGDGIWDWNLERNEISFSERWKSMFGFGGIELNQSTDNWFKRIHPEDVAQAMMLIEKLVKGEREDYSQEYRMRCKDNQWKWVLDRGMVLNRDSAGRPRHLLGIVADVSKIKQSEQALWQYANVDTLTGLPNRRMFYSSLEQALQKAKRGHYKLAMIFLDLDGFKEVNDTQGHDQGDLLLKESARRLSNCVSENDLVARLGGDEFVLILDHVDVHYVEQVARNVISRLNAPFKLAHSHAYVSASLGIAIFPDDASNHEDLMKRVDQAMYASKQKGGGCFTYFTPRMQAHAENRMQLSNDLRLAISKKQFFLEYQPIVNLETLEVYKAEALIRWQHPTRGLVGPSEFISIAEDFRMITQIGDWVFKNAIEQCQQWREQLHPAFQMAVNKSPVQFISHKRVDDWLNKLQKSGLSGQMVMVEITESLLLDANVKVSERLQAYKKAGVQLALDDFGTGYSALSYLKKFPIDVIKIDRMFVKELGTSGEDEALCQALIAMAHSLGLKVVAEGIETETQLRILQEMGCNYGQGFFFTHPLRASAFQEWYQLWLRAHVANNSPRQKTLYP